MPIPSTIQDVSTAAASNSPAGSETPSTIDNYIRAISAFVAQLRDNSHQALQSVAGTDTITATLAAPITAYSQAAFRTFRAVMVGTNTTTTPTLNLCSLGAVTILMPGGGAPPAGAIPANGAEFWHNGTNFVLMNPAISNGSISLAKLDTTGAAGKVLTAQGVGNPPQWVATGIQASGITAVTSTSAIPAGAIGGTVTLSSASAIAPTLPAANSVIAGQRIEFVNINSGVATLNRAGADTITLGTSSTVAVAITGGDTLTLESDGTSKWIAVGGTALLQYLPLLSRSISGGWIDQPMAGNVTPTVMKCGNANLSAGAGNTTVTFPKAFVNACSAVVIGPAYNGGYLYIVSGLSTTGFTIANSSGAATGSTVWWIAMGY